MINPLLVEFTSDDAIESILKYFKEHDNYAPTEADLFDIDGRYSVEQNGFMEALIKMQTLEIITSIQDGGRRFRLTKLGYEIIEIGGWKEYLDQERYKRKLIERNYKWFWGVVGLSVLSAFFSGYSTYTKTQSISEIELRLSKVENQLQQLQQKPNPYTLPLPIHPSATVSPSKE